MDTNRWDFSGWATKNNIRCSDGRVIRKDAFKECDGHTVPLVWNHQHNDPNDILGHARLENREEGVYAYCSFNDSENAKSAKEAVKHGDVAAMSIFANQLKQQGSNVIHGAIREVSLVLAGANPGAFIESIICHNDEGNYDEESDEAVIYTGEKLDLYHAEDQAKNSNSDNEETIGDVFNTVCNLSVREKDSLPVAWLSRNRKNQENYLSDPLCGFPLKLGGYRDLFALAVECGRREWATLVPEELPIMIISGAKDPVGFNGKGTLSVADNLVLAGHEPTVILYTTTKSFITTFFRGCTRFIFPNFPNRSL